MFTIRLPSLDEEPEFDRARRSIPADNPTFLHHYQPGMPLRQYLDVIENHRTALTALPLTQVPSTFLFAFDGSRIIGRVSIRHTLNEALTNVGGHIGYAVLPEFRNRGNGTRILKWAVRYAQHTLKINRLLLTCDEDNAASIKVIQHNGGVFESTYQDKTMAAATRRYWIEATTAID